MSTSRPQPQTIARRRSTRELVRLDGPCSNSSVDTIRLANPLEAARSWGDVRSAQDKLKAMQAAGVRRFHTSTIDVSNTVLKPTRKRALVVAMLSTPEHTHSMGRSTMSSSSARS